MLDIVAQDRDWVELRASGKLTREDYERVVPSLEAQLEREGRLRALIVLVDFEGWTSGGALDDLRFDLRHRKDFERMAIVGEGRLEEWGTRLSSPFFSGEVRFFDRSREPEARAWALGLEEKPELGGTRSRQ